MHTKSSLLPNHASLLPSESLTLGTGPTIQLGLYERILCARVYSALILPRVRKFALVRHARLRHASPASRTHFRKKGVSPRRQRHVRFTLVTSRYFNLSRTEHFTYVLGRAHSGT